MEPGETKWTMKLVGSKGENPSKGDVFLEEDGKLRVYDGAAWIDAGGPHEFYNVRLGRMEYISEFIVGEDKVMKSDKTEHMLVGHERIEGEFRHCTLFTRKFNTYFANRILAGNRDSAKWGWKSRS